MSIRNIAFSVDVNTTGGATNFPGGFPPMPGAYGAPSGAPAASSNNRNSARNEFEIML